MTTIAMTPDPQLGVTQTRAMSSEWIKFRTLRSTWWSIGAALLVSVGLGIVFAALRGNDIQNHGGFEPDMTALTLRGFYLAQLAVGVLGVLFVTGEYSTGMIRATLSAIPRRPRVWAAKTAVFAATIFVITLVAAFVAFLAGQGVLSTYSFHGYHFHGSFLIPPKGRVTVVQNALQVHQLGVSLSHPGSLRAIFGAALFMVGVGLLGIGLGFAIRNTGGAIAALFGVLLVLPLLAQALPSSLQDHVIKYLPLIAGTSGMNTLNGTDQLSPWAGLGVLALWVVAALGAGALVLRRRDA
jgi:ABC-2 type transport system permease protein